MLSPFLADIRKHICAIVAAEGPDRVVDICCGTGEQVRLLRKAGIDAVGIDLSTAMLKVATRKGDSSHFYYANATKMPFDDAAFDFAVIAFALHETARETAQKIVAEIRRVLKPGGHLLIVDYDLSEKTGIRARRIINIIEWLAGGTHYRNFRSYLKAGGLAALLEKSYFTPIKDKHRAEKSIILRLLKKKE